MHAMPSLRFADADTAARYPLPTSGAAAWASGGTGARLVVELGDLGAGTIVVPSLAFRLSAEADDTGEPGPAHRWTLRAAERCWPLQWVPATEPPAAPQKGSPVSTHVDCFRVHRALSGTFLELELDSEIPRRYLVCVSSRAFTVAAPPLPESAAALPCPPPQRSQLSAPEAIAQRICSPTCVSIVLDAWRRPHDWLEVAAECHDPVTGMFGVWPLALRAAARRGCIGAVEVFAGWREPMTVLERGVPLVTSIRFSAGELPGAPLPETSGHLVVVYAAGPDEILVCDPAANPGEVHRSYPATAFSAAWLRHRGAAYILPP